MIIKSTVPTGVVVDPTSRAALYPVSRALIILNAAGYLSGAVITGGPSMARNFTRNRSSSLQSYPSSPRLICGFFLQQLLNRNRLNLRWIRIGFFRHLIPHNFHIFIGAYQRKIDRAGNSELILTRSVKSHPVHSVDKITLLVGI